MVKQDTCHFDVRECRLLPRFGMRPRNSSGETVNHLSRVHQSALERSVGGSTKENGVQDNAPTPTNVTFVARSILPSVAHSGPLNCIPTEFFPVTSFIRTPVQVHILKHYLKSHPNQQLVDFVVAGFTFGFKLGFNDRVLASASNNNKSAFDHESKVDETILKELNRGHNVGPFDHFSLSMNERR